MAAARIVLYTCIMGGYDHPLAQPAAAGVERVCFTDRPPRRSRGWQIRPPAGPPGGEALSPALMNRWHKVFGPEFFPEADVTIYIDGNVVLAETPQRLAAMLGESGAALAALAHSRRRSVTEELAACIATGRLSPDEAARAGAMLARHRAAGDADDRGLLSNHLLVRRGGDAALARAMRRWWACIREVPRDQLSLGHCLWAEGVAALRLDTDRPRESVAVRLRHGASRPPLPLALRLALAAARRGRGWPGAAGP